MIQDRQPVWTQLVAGREAERAQHAGRHTNQHMALTYTGPSAYNTLLNIEMLLLLG